MKFLAVKQYKGKLALASIAVIIVLILGAIAVSSLMVKQEKVNISYAAGDGEREHYETTEKYIWVLNWSKLLDKETMKMMDVKVLAGGEEERYVAILSARPEVFIVDLETGRVLMRKSFIPPQIGFIKGSYIDMSKNAKFIAWVTTKPSPPALHIAVRKGSSIYISDVPLDYREKPNPTSIRIVGSNARYILVGDRFGWVACYKRVIMKWIKLGTDGVEVISKDFLPRDDAYVGSDGPGYDNWFLWMRNASGHSVTYRTYVKFDLSEIHGKSVSNVKLYMYKVKGEPDIVAVYQVNDDKWLEEKIDWKNAPKPSKMLASERVDSEGWGIWESEEMTKWVAETVGPNGDNVVSFMLNVPRKTDSLHVFCSKEYAGPPPPSPHEGHRVEHQKGYSELKLKPFLRVSIPKNDPSVDMITLYFGNDGKYAYFKEKLCGSPNPSSFTYTVYLDKPIGGFTDFRLVYTSGKCQLEKWNGSTWEKVQDIHVTVVGSELTFKVPLEALKNPEIKQDANVWFINYEGHDSYDRVLDRAPNTGGYFIGKDNW